MILDQQLIFSDAQVLTATANSTNLVDQGASRDLGRGVRLTFIMHVSAVSGTSPTIAALLVGADDAAFATNKITLATIATLSPPVANTIYRAVPASLPNTPKRYLRVEYTIGGTTPSVTVTATLVLDDQTTQPQ
jgi:hypothetical protein